jgi:hypothetical protein
MPLNFICSFHNSPHILHDKRFKATLDQPSTPHTKDSQMLFAKSRFLVFSRYCYCNEKCTFWRLIYLSRIFSLCLSYSIHLGIFGMEHVDYKEYFPPALKGDWNAMTKNISKPLGGHLQKQDSSGSISSKFATRYDFLTIIIITVLVSKHQG